jgi:mono/diheme cytochrome c family protein
MSRRIWIVVAVVAVVALLVGAVLMHNVMQYGFSAHDEPTRLESMMATMMRHYSAPADLRDARNPIPLTPDILAESRAHFADHCSTCHGNDGKGKTEMGPHFYPRTPDLTSPSTQSQTDGELFATIENGIRMTGMPGWGDGTAESARGSWTLVHFIRHLPKITPQELEEMKTANPISPAEMQDAKQEQKEEDQFLNGDDGNAQSSTATQPHSH